MPTISRLSEPDEQSGADLLLANWTHLGRGQAILADSLTAAARDRQVALLDADLTRLLQVLHHRFQIRSSLLDP
jgi:hypothetical protein